MINRYKKITYGDIMNGFYITKDNETIRSHENRAGIFRLLIDNDDLEVFESYINIGKSIICQPYESINSTNIIIVLEGKMFYTNEKRYVGSGDIITFKNLDFTHHLSVVEVTKLLMIRNSKYFDQQTSKNDSTYEMIHKIQEKDQYTEDHCNNTGNLAVQIATMMKLSEMQVENILHAGKIHDVGKLMIPKEILNKPARLTPEEYEIIMKHSQYGYDIVMDETNDLELARIVLDHHERLDGSGYPKGLKGDEISIEARILSVVDSFDAMTSNRPYKNTISAQSALKDLKMHIGTWYDKKVVDCLAEIISFTMN
jgi:HD-GYP domain-containing protein (c-di-GMP phosphodiesterase class II)